MCTLSASASASGPGGFSITFRQRTAPSAARRGMMHHPGIVRASHIVELPCHTGLLLNAVEPELVIMEHAQRLRAIWLNGPGKFKPCCGATASQQLACTTTSVAHDSTYCTREVSLRLDLPSMRRHEAWEIARALYDAKRKLLPPGSFRVRFDRLQLGV